MRKLILIVAVLALLPAAALAGGYSVPNVNPRDLSMAGSLQAAQEDAAAVYANPAALSRLKGASLSVAGSVIDFKSTWTDPGAGNPTGQGPTSMITKLVFPPALYAAYGVDLGEGRGIGLGIGFNLPFGGNVFWPDNATWPGRFDIETVERRIYATYFSFGAAPVKWLRFGGGFVWYRGTEKLSQGVNYLSYESKAELGTAGDAYSYDLSLELQPIEEIRIGVDYKHKADMTLHGHAHFYNPPSSLAPNTIDQLVVHPLTMPNVVQVGIGVRPIPVLLVTAAYSWFDDSVYDKDAFIGSAGTTIIVPRNYKDGQTFRLGVEVGPFAGFKFRAGGLRDLAPTPAEWMSPTIPDANVWAFSVGLGWQATKTLAVNAAYFHAFFDQVNTTNTPQYVFPGIYDTRANIGSIGIVWNPGEF